MSNKFTGITSAGSAIPVYDKDAHSALEQKLDTSAFSSVSGEFATVDDVVAAVSGKADTSAIPSLDGYATQEWVGEQGFLTEVPESAVSGFATYEEVESATSGLMQTSGLEYDGDKISGYMGSAFKAGDELPSGVMVESAVEYNAVNEISGYNGSAIAQYGAEKQWLVHDDTLVHASNSAQYALGVNLSAVAQLLGVDETVLWSGSKGSVNDTMDLNEPISAFNKIKFQIDEGNTNIPIHDFVSNTNGTILYPYYMRTNAQNAQLCGLWSLSRSDNDTRLSVSIAILRTNGTTTGTNSSKIIKVVGIGRRSKEV